VVPYEISDDDVIQDVWLGFRRLWVECFGSSYLESIPTVFRWKTLGDLYLELASLGMEDVSSCPR